ncbi:MAG TPA: transcriptional regulator [Candidatus Omnitrophica bacterium]|nr:transcriptional regulator [Candidatus Omnitrophota bacterium]HCI44287.1 transcriptional regulator [Candidatus Omnitrophota bacterium]
MRFKESETIELKKSTSELKEAIISIGAMLNKHSKATVYFGIDDTGTVFGQQIGKSTLRDISKAISDWIEPKVFPDIQTKKISGKNCIIVNVSGHDAVYSARGRYYLRIGEEDKRLSVNELKRLVEKKSNYIYSWGFDVSDLPVSKADVPTIKSFVAKGRKAGRIEYAYDSARNVLNKLHLVKGRKLLNAGRALFCKDNRVEVRAAVFATDEKTTFLDIQSFKGTLFDLIAQCETYVKEHINWRADLSGSTRIEIPEVPVRAMKEAIVNSLCHRDFNNPSGNELAIYRNRIEIYNPGQFPYDHSPEEFIKGTEKSIPRNPLIADTFYYAKDIERWGSGFKRIVDECKVAGVKVTFENIKTGFVVTFYRPKAGPTLQKAEKGSEKSSEKSSEKIIRIIRENPSVSAQEIAGMLGLSSRAVEKHLSKLKEKGVLKRVGPDKGGHWEVVVE